MDQFIDKWRSNYVDEVESTNDESKQKDIA